MKKLLALILAAFMMVAMFAACGDETKAEETKTDAPVEAPADEPADEPEDEIEAAVDAFMDELIASALDSDMLLDGLMELDAGADLTDDEIEDLEKACDKVVDAFADSFSFTVSDVKIDGETATANLTMSGPDMSGDELDVASVFADVIGELNADSTAYDIFAAVLDEMADLIENMDKTEESGEIELEIVDGVWTIVG